jgi:hypothetical protein
MVFVPHLAIRKLSRFVNTIAPLPVPVRQSLHNLQRRGAFIAAFTSEKRWMTIKINLFRNWQLILNFFIAKFANPCTMYNQRRSWSFRALKGWGTGRFFLKTSAPLSLMTTYPMSLI